MIAGLSSFGLAESIRSAGRARATMDDMSRQLATGQKVSSVKDNGAAWVQASSARSQKAEIAGRGTIVDFLREASNAEMIEDQAMNENWALLRDVFVRATAAAPGSSTRAQLHTEFQGLLEQVRSSAAPTGAIASGYQQFPGGPWGIVAGGADTVIAGRRIYATLDSAPVAGQSNSAFWLQFDYKTFSTTPAAVPNRFESIDLRTASATDVRDGLYWLTDWMKPTLGYSASDIAGDQRFLDHVVREDARKSDRLDSTISALTDADLGQASTRLRVAETRNQLALATVREAIAAYGSFASGLLGNVRSTQQAIA